MKIGTIVRSTAGRDAGRLMTVVGFPREGYCFICDGRLRKVEQPKLKKLRHLESVGESEELVRLIGEGKLTNSLLKKQLALIQGEA